jgi:hypothetical protein
MAPCPSPPSGRRTLRRQRNGGLGRGPANLVREPEQTRMPDMNSNASLRRPTAHAAVARRAAVPLMAAAHVSPLQRRPNKRAWDQRSSQPQYVLTVAAPSPRLGHVGGLHRHKSHGHLDGSPL